MSFVQNMEMVFFAKTNEMQTVLFALFYYCISVSYGIEPPKYPKLKAIQLMYMKAQISN